MPLSAEQLEPLFVTMDDFLAAVPNVQPSSKREGFATVPDVPFGRGNGDHGAHRKRDEHADVQFHVLGNVSMGVGHGALLQKIKHWEEEDPHEVDKVPIEARALDTVCVVLRVLRPQ